MSQDEKWCHGWITEAQQYCRSTDALRYFPNGFMCPAHYPIQPPPPGPGIPAYRRCGRCEHIKRDHATQNPLKPGRCHACSCTMYEESST